jgi:hypothetical protein
MITPQQFLEAFFQEKVAVYAEANVHLAPVYAKYFGDPISKRVHDFLLIDHVKAVVEEVRQSTDSAIAITREGWAKTYIRTRYHLAKVGEGWKIIRIDRQGLHCLTSGQSQDCQKCGGEGWYDSNKNAG